MLARTNTKQAATAKGGSNRMKTENALLCDFDDEFILKLLLGQLNFFQLTGQEAAEIKAVYPRTKERIGFCFLHAENKYFQRDGSAYFSPFHSGQWCIFLYYLGNSLFKASPDNRVICDKIYYLNRMLNSCDIFYEVDLPDVFFLEHPVGSVIGRGVYGNYFSFNHGCTVGKNKGICPQLGERVKMLSNSKILGNSVIGNNVIIAANAYVKDTNIPDNSIVFGVSPNLVIKPNRN